MNWLLLPGGPGIGSESLQELADAMLVPGSIWLVDLPGDGSNLSQRDNPFASWPGVLIEAAKAVVNPVYVVCGVQQRQATHEFFQLRRRQQIHASGGVTMPTSITRTARRGGPPNCRCCDRGAIRIAS